jgi:hypothetical protein
MQYIVFPISAGNYDLPKLKYLLIITVNKAACEYAEKFYGINEIQGLKRNSPADERGKQAGNGGILIWYVNI